MPHRIKEISAGSLPNPLFAFDQWQLDLSFADAAKLLQAWRNPVKARGIREGIVVALMTEAQLAIETISQKLMYNALSQEQEEELLETLKILRYMSATALPEALELVTQDKLLTEEDIRKFIQKHLQGLQEEYGNVRGARRILNRLQEITDLEIVDSFGNRRRVKKDEVIEFLGSILGSFLAKQSALQPLHGVTSKPLGKVLPLQTYKAAAISSTRVPPESIDQDDIRVLDKDRVSLIYLIVDMSQSMRRVVFEQGLSRLDGALLTSLGLYYFFTKVNRKKGRIFKPFTLAIVPITKTPEVIDDEEKLEQFLLKAKAEGRTRLVHAVIKAVEHARKQKLLPMQAQQHATLICITDGRPNVPYEGIIPGIPSNAFVEYMKTRTISNDMKTCMIQLNQIFNYLRMDKSLSWTIQYFLIAPKKATNSPIYKDTVEMLRGITKPILVDPAKLETLASQIARESLASY